MANKQTRTFSLGEFVVYLVAVYARKGKDGNLFFDVSVKGDDKPLPIPPLSDGIGSVSLSSQEWDKLVELLIEGDAKLALSNGKAGAKAKAVKLTEFLSGGKRIGELTGASFLTNVEGQPVTTLKMGVDGSSVKYGTKKVFVNVDGMFLRSVHSRARRERKPRIGW